MADPVNPIPGPSDSNPPKLAPEAVVVHLRTIRSQIDDVEPLSQAQRKRVRRRLRSLPSPVVEASINVIGVLDNVSQAIGQPLDEVRRLQDETLRWDAAIDEARAFLKDASPSTAGAAAGPRPFHDRESIEKEVVKLRLAQWKAATGVAALHISSRVSRPS